MKLKVKDNCPLDNFNPCRKFECGWFIQIRGKHPQTGEEVDEYGCAMALMPMLMIENSRQTNLPPFFKTLNASFSVCLMLFVFLKPKLIV